MKKQTNCCFEIKSIAAEVGPEMEFSGYGSVFGNLDAYGDVIAKGAFVETLAEAKSNPHNWPRLLAQHGGYEASSMMPIGKWETLREDDYGLYAEGKFADTQAGIEAYKLLKMGAISGLSIGYTPIEWTNRSKPEEPRRTLKKIKLWEVSLVTFPANEKATVLDVKTALNPRLLEQALCDAGLSRIQAKRVLSGGISALTAHCDDEAAYKQVEELFYRNIKQLRGNK